MKGAVMIRTEQLEKLYRTEEVETAALRDVDLEIDQGEYVAVMGPSGCGKSTLLNILGGLDVPSAGTATVAGFDLLTMSADDRTRYRQNVIGFVWQQTARNLLPYLSAIANVELPMILGGVSSAGRRAKAMNLLELVGLADRREHKPAQLSGGEQQRVAIATALANSPEVVFADEPTGELDTRTSAEVFDVLRRVNQAQDVTVVVVTHDPLVAGHVSRTVAIRDGRTSSEVVRRAEVSDEGEHHVVAEEFAVLDRVGRLQLPTDYVEALELERRVKLTLDDDHINVWPDRSASESEDSA